MIEYTLETFYILMCLSVLLIDFLLYHVQIINSIGKKKYCSFDFIIWSSMINNVLLWSNFFEHKGQMSLSAVPFSWNRTAVLYGIDWKPRGREIWRICTMSSITFTFLILQLKSNFILVNLVSDICFNHLAFQISGIFLTFHLLQFSLTNYKVVN